MAEKRESLAEHFEKMGMAAQYHGSAASRHGLAFVFHSLEGNSEKALNSLRNHLGCKAREAASTLPLKTPTNLSRTYSKLTRLARQFHEEFGVWLPKGALQEFDAARQATPHLQQLARKLLTHPLIRKPAREFISQQKSPAIIRGLEHNQALRAVLRKQSQASREQQTTALLLEKALACEVPSELPAFIRNKAGKAKASSKIRGLWKFAKQFLRGRGVNAREASAVGQLFAHLELDYAAYHHYNAIQKKFPQLHGT